MEPISCYRSGRGYSMKNGKTSFGVGIRIFGPEPKLRRATKPPDPPESPTLLDFRLIARRGTRAKATVAARKNRVSPPLSDESADAGNRAGGGCTCQHAFRRNIYWSVPVRAPMSVATKLTKHVQPVSRRSRMRAYMQLARPANLFTAAADILAGSAAAGAWTAPVLGLLVPAGVCLYAGGVVFNDVFDRHLDAIERPERPIPSGLATAKAAAVLGAILLLAGIFLAFLASPSSGMMAVAIAVSVLLYDRWSKHHALAGPVNMGLCRGLNLMLGVTAAAVIPVGLYLLPVIPIVYISAVTALSAGEVHGGNRGTVMAAIVAMAVVIVAVPSLAMRTSEASPLWATPFLGLLVFRVLRPLWHAWHNPEPQRIFAAVKAGVLSLIVLNSAIAAAWMGPIHGVLILLLLPVAGRVARIFAVT